MYTFKDFPIGGMFNTKIARYVKISDNDAIVVMSAHYKIGDIRQIPETTEILPLYPSINENLVEQLENLERYNVYHSNTHGEWVMWDDVKELIS